jgi:leucyl-tRNA---protein transferase
MGYTNFGNTNIDITNPQNVIKAYEDGYVATRKELTYFERVRSLRVNLLEFEESSENRRILRKYSHEIIINPIPFPEYSWEIHKLGKDFYETKFGTDVFSANKIKELFTSAKTNFNTILSFKNIETGKIDGYCICLSSSNSDDTKILHYAYPFYNLDLINSSFGIFMMTKTITTLKTLGYNYIYLGSVHETASLYKLQFKGESWWDEEKEQWTPDLDKLKNRIR